jgi:hypothetical protein
VSTQNFLRASAAQLYDLPLSSTTMSSDIPAEQMQAKITAARRDAEALKDKIKRRKDDLLDTSRKSILSLANAATVLSSSFKPLSLSSRVATQPYRNHLSYNHLANSNGILSHGGRTAKYRAAS